MAENKQTLQSPCDICLDEKCEGRHDCNCATCELASKCIRRLRPTIRITNRCTQMCSHCCFESHPKSNIMMTIEMSENIAQFIKNNGIEYVNLMGGEFFCNPDWFNVLSNIIAEVKLARLVTNGDWVNNTKVKEQLKLLADKFRDKMYFCISKDRWHTNKHVDEAKEYLDGIDVITKVATEDQTTNQSIVPVGRALGQYISGIYDAMGCYCHNPENMYTFLIDEEGDIYKCSFGMFRYDNINEYLNGGFRPRFKEYNTFFYSKFIPSCNTCSMFNTMNNNGEHGKIMVKCE